MAILSRHTQAALAVTALIVTVGTTYGVVHQLYLDTSNPILAYLPHPSHTSYFSKKESILNQLFVKKAWGWTSGAFFAVWVTQALEGVVSYTAIAKWLSTTAVWLVFAGWFFGPSIFNRIITYSGGECVISIPPPSPDAPPQLVTVPSTFCDFKTTVTPETYPQLFADSLLASQELQPGYVLKPRLTRGHDVSGHVFLLTLSVFFLVDTLVRTKRARSVSSLVAQVLGWALVGLWLVMMTATAVYFHTPDEKISAYVIALIGFYISQWPIEMLFPTDVDRQKKLA